jgi:hypothetical protein
MRVYAGFIRVKQDLMRDASRAFLINTSRTCVIYFRVAKDVRKTSKICGVFEMRKNDKKNDD